MSSSAKLGDIAPAKPLKKPDQETDKDVWHLNLDQIESNSGQILEEVIAPIAEAKNSTHWFDERHVLYSKLRPYLNKVVVPHKHGVATTELVPMMPDPQKLKRGYLAYYLKSDKFVQWVNAQVAGAKMPRVSMKVFWNHRIPLPPLPVQQKIATILDTADALKQKDKALIAKYDELCQSLFLDMFGDPVINPKGWDIDSLASFGSFKNGINFSKGETGVKVRCLGVGDFGTHSKISYIESLPLIDLTTLPSENYFLRNRDVVFVRSNGNKELVGRCIVVYPGDEKVTYSGFCIRYRIEVSGINSTYLAHLFRMQSFRSQLLQGGQGANIQNINQKTLVALKIPVPPIAIQNQFEERIQAIKQQKLQAQASLQKSEDLFNCLLQKAFKGELVA